VVLALLPGSLAANEIRETTINHATERHLPDDEPVMLWSWDPAASSAQAGDRLETVEVETVEPETVKLTDVVPPIFFESGVARIPDSTVAELRAVLESMRERHNVRVNLVGHADSQPLSVRLKAVYGDNAGLSRERAGQVAEYFKQTLNLPAEAISFEWAGDGQPISSNATQAGRAMNRRVEVEVWYDELRDSVMLDEQLVVDEMKRVKVCRIEKVCKLRYVEGHERRAKVVNLVAPLHYDEDSVAVTPGFVSQLNRTLANLRDKQNVVVKFVGYTDDQPLIGQIASIYANHDALSKARARRVALAVQDELALATAAVKSDGRGASRPLASNETPEGRALNRRVEVEFWYDDPLQDLPDEPQMCPGEPGAEMVTRIYDPPWGEIEHVELDAGQPVLLAGYGETLKRALNDVADRNKARLRFVGYTRNERLDRRTAMVYGDDIGLSAARARRTMEALAAELELTVDQAEFEGRGYLHSNDVVNAGFIQGEDSFVAVQVVYDELAVIEDAEGIEVTPLVRELETKNPFALNLMRITVDGEPIDDPGRSSSDVQRCTDVAMKSADIQFTFDNLTSSPRLSVAASPTVLPMHGDGAGGKTGDPVTFRMYANYEHFIDSAEIRIFEAGQSPQATPRQVVPVDKGGFAEWQPDVESFVSTVRELSYVLRAYGEDGNFDETDAQPLWLVHNTEISDIDANVNEYFEDLEPRIYTPRADAVAGVDPLLDRQLLAEYGENALSMHNIRLSSGTVRVQGSDVPDGHSVYVAGREVPVDDDGNFVSEEVLPEGAHTVEVAVVDEAGSGEAYLRDVVFEPDDWFYVGMADLTLSTGSSDGALDELTGNNAPYELDSSADGRLSFYVNGKFGNKWRLTAAADTREEPIEDLFNNFTRKTPDALLRRLDPDYHYPTFGDDSSVEEIAPTNGKVYLKLAQRKSYGMWGNFTVGYMENELAQIDRGLYGGNLHYETQSTTSFGEQRLTIDAFGAEPGTVPSRQEFRGTGGSLYFLRHQDLSIGSERLRIEIRDRSSGLVTGVVNLSPTLDYDIDYLQGSVLLAEPLMSTVNDNLLVRSGAMSGDEAYLVVRYEYTPGLEDIDALAVGGQMHAWLNDYIRLGVTASSNEEDDLDSSLNGFDVVLRKSTDTWVKLQASESDGLDSYTLRSDDGGFGFIGYEPGEFAGNKAGAYRADLSVGFEDILPSLDGRLTLYGQDLEAGFSGPGFASPTDTENYGGTLSVPLSERMSVFARYDRVSQEEGIETDAAEVDVAFQLSRGWDLSTGVRHEKLTDSSPLAILQNDGERTDGVVELGYDSSGIWRAYGFVQETLSKDGSREDNGRVGMGSTVRLSEKMTVDMEVSDGDTGAGGRMGTTYMYSERTSLYLNYMLESEGVDPIMRAPRGSEGSLVSGVKSRLTDSTSVFVEERYRHGDSANGLTHATGVNFSPDERWSLGANTDIGQLRDLLTGTETDRKAIGARFGFGTDTLQISTAVEYRRDENDQLDLPSTERTTWLFRNNFKLQMTPAYRLLGKLNHADSDSSLGDFFAGGYTEGVVGFGYRPVRNDRLNALAKYTYFYNLPTTGQETTNGSAAEYLQRSHIGSMDVTYDLTPNWTIGGKYAYRLSQISLDREDPDYFDNSASLYVLRADYRFRENWEVLMETRLLDMTDLDEQRSGALFAVSRYVGDHLKIGVGYNFTDFSSDLTDLSFDHDGVFLNFTGAL
jgi:flagellar motor protein MotB